MPLAPADLAEGDSNRSDRRRAWQDAHLDDDTRRLLDADARVFLHQSLSTPCLNVLRACEGPFVEDLAGRRYYDFHGNWVHQVGFRHPRVIAALTAQLQTLPFSTRRYTNAPAIALAEALTARAPGDLRRVLFAPGGAEANSMALQIARAATGRHKTVSMWDAFHGATLDTISIGGEAQFRRNAGPLLPGTEHVPPPNPDDCPFACGTACSLRCAHYLDYVLGKEGDVAAVIGETVRNLPFIPPPDYWRIVREACDRHGALLILDEIPIAFGRTGRFFAVEHYGVVPDMLVLGKGLGGGVMPLAAVLAREHLTEAAGRAIGHFTHEKNPVACAAGKAFLEVLDEERVLDHVQRLEPLALGELERLRRRFPAVGPLRGLGLLLGFPVLDAHGQPDADTAERLMYAALSRGLSFKITMGHLVCLAPALTITEAQLRDALGLLERALEDVHPPA